MEIDNDAVEGSTELRCGSTVFTRLRIDDRHEPECSSAWQCGQCGVMVITSGKWTEALY